MKPTDHETEVEKDGIDTGLKAINPFSGEELPVWIGNYVMMEYGTGAVMSVPAHDERDFEFAKKFGLPIKTGHSNRKTQLHRRNSKLQRLDSTEPLRNTAYWLIRANGPVKSSEDAKTRNGGICSTNMDLAKRRRHIACATGAFRVSDFGERRSRSFIATNAAPFRKNLRICRFDCLKTRPITGTGESPLQRFPNFTKRRVQNVMGRHTARRTRWTLSSIRPGIIFRYTDPANEDPAVRPEIAAYWTPVDQYIGGDDHAVMHLIYARFWTKVCGIWAWSNLTSHSSVC